MIDDKMIYRPLKHATSLDFGLGEALPRRAAAERSEPGGRGAQETRPLELSSGC